MDSTHTDILNRWIAYLIRRGGVSILDIVNSITGQFPERWAHAHIAAAVARMRDRGLLAGGLGELRVVADRAMIWGPRVPSTPEGEVRNRRAARRATRAAQHAAVEMVRARARRATVRRRFARPGGVEPHTIEHREGVAEAPALPGWAIEGDR